MDANVRFHPPEVKWIGSQPASGAPQWTVAEFQMGGYQQHPERISVAALAATHTFLRLPPTAQKIRAFAVAAL